MTVWVSTLSHDGTEAQLTHVDNFVVDRENNDRRLLTDLDGHPMYLVAVFPSDTFTFEQAKREHHEACDSVRLLLQVRDADQ